MTTTDTGVTLDQHVDFLRAMHEIRYFEDECHRMFAQGLVRGSTHLGQGQEAVAVGACRALRKGDTMSCTYRGHGAVLAMGSPLDRAFGEILGKAGGLCGGKGGSMHLTDVERGVLGSFAIVGAHLPIAVGAAFAARYRDTEARAAVASAATRSRARRRAPSGPTSSGSPRRSTTGPGTRPASVTTAPTAASPTSCGRWSSGARRSGSRTRRCTRARRWGRTRSRARGRSTSRSRRCPRRRTPGSGGASRGR
jgi:hypothetical protein